MRIIRFADLIEIPWKNGGGVTRNIAEDRDGDALRWRLSTADVDRDGPFSDFAGLTRILTIIAGGDMVLSGPDGDITAAWADPVVFDGATPVTATLADGPLRDLNLMFDPQMCEGNVAPLHGPMRKDLIADAGATTGVLCVRGDVAVNGLSLGEGDTALGGGVTIETGDNACALLVTLRPR